MIARLDSVHMIYTFMRVMPNKGKKVHFYYFKSEEVHSMQLIIHLVNTSHVSIVMVNDCCLLDALHSLSESIGVSLKLDYRVIVNSTKGSHNSFVHPLNSKYA